MILTLTDTAASEVKKFLEAENVGMDGGLRVRVVGPGAKREQLLSTAAGCDATFVLDAIALATVIELFVMPVSGWLSDLIGRRTLYLIGTAFTIFFAFPLFWLIGTRDPAVVLWTIVVGHATFCVVVVYNNVLARLRRTAGSITEASMDLGADGWKTFRLVTLPTISTAPSAPP